MKFYLSRRRKRVRAFSLAEAALSVGLLSFGFLSAVPLIGLGANAAREARTGRVAAQIAETLVQQAQQGTLSPGTAYFDSAENVCPSAGGASYEAKTSLASAAGAPGGGTLVRLTVQVMPLGAPTHSECYAVDLPPSP
jgi:type II secretory pathway pseudopilin PulG